MAPNKQISIAGCIAVLLSWPHRILAAVFNGGSMNAGITHANNITGLSTLSPRELILKILLYVLNFLALFAVVAIIIAGFYLVVSNGGEENKDKAKKIILYVVIGLIVIFFARVIVNFVLTVIQ